MTNAATLTANQLTVESLIELVFSMYNVTSHTVSYAKTTNSAYVKFFQSFEGGYKVFEFRLSDHIANDMRRSASNYVCLFESGKLDAVQAIELAYSKGIETVYPIVIELENKAALIDKYNELKNSGAVVDGLYFCPIFNEYEGKTVTHWNALGKGVNITYTLK